MSQLPDQLRAAYREATGSVRPAAIRDLQRQGFNLFAIGSILGTGDADPQAAELAALLERVASRDRELIATLQRHGIIARSASGGLRVTRPKPLRTALTLRQLGVPLLPAIRILADVLDAAAPVSGDLVRLVHTEMVDNWDSSRGPSLSSHPMARTQAVITLLSEATQVVLENAGIDLVRGALGAGECAGESSAIPGGGQLA